MVMKSETPEKQSQLIMALREGVSVVQMILFKEVRTGLANKFPEKEAGFLSMLTGAIVNDVFGSANPEEKFVAFHNQNRGLIEQELLAIPDEHKGILPALTDALRIQSLCDHQEGMDSSATLTRANELGILITERDIPLPSTFMTFIRDLGEQHDLIIPPVQITPDEDKGMVH